MKSPTLAIVGCTGSGKGGLARELALRTGAEIISVDSMKIYRRLDIGTAKPSRALRERIAHHLIDVIEPSEEFSVAAFVQQAEAALADLRQRRRPAILVGGTVLYFKALMEGLFEGPGADADVRRDLNAVADVDGSPALHRRLSQVDPVAAIRIHPNDRKRLVRALEVYELTGTPISDLQAQWDRDRPRHDLSVIGLRRSREDQNQRTNERVRRMIEAGLVDEVKSLLGESAPLSRTARHAVGYAEMIRHLDGEISLDEAVEMIKINTRHFAKSQRTWLRRVRNVQWVDLDSESKAGEIAARVLDSLEPTWST